MKKIVKFMAFISGLVFGMGLLISGMANPAKILGFLDLAGKWDPSLALVMVGAIIIGLPAFYLETRKKIAFCGDAIDLPPTNNIDKKLILGSFAFGIGWGLVGFCPGPALVAVGTGSIKAIVFTLAMIAGMLIFEMLQSKMSTSV
jgi:uncharacterized membrane protein YedE/YeeE